MGVSGGGEGGRVNLMRRAVRLSTLVSGRGQRPSERECRRSGRMDRCLAALSAGLLGGDQGPPKRLVGVPVAVPPLVLALLPESLRA